MESHDAPIAPEAHTMVLYTPRTPTTGKTRPAITKPPESQLPVPGCSNESVHENSLPNPPKSSSKKRSHVVKRRKTDHDEEKSDAGENDEDAGRSSENVGYLKKQIREGNNRAFVLRKRFKKHTESQRIFEAQLTTYNQSLVRENIELQAQVQSASSEIERWRNLSWAWKNNAANREQEIKSFRSQLTALKEENHVLINNQKSKDNNGAETSDEQAIWFQERQKLVQNREEWIVYGNHRQARVTELEERVKLAQTKIDELQSTILINQKIHDQMIQNFEAQMNVALQSGSQVPRSFGNLAQTDMNNKDSPKPPSNGENKQDNLAAPHQKNDKGDSAVSNGLGGDDRGQVDEHEDGEDESANTLPTGSKPSVQSEAVRAALLQRKLRNGRTTRIKSNHVPMKSSGGDNQPKPSGGDQEMADPGSEESNENDASGESDGEQGSARRRKPITEKSVKRIARTVVREELELQKPVYAPTKKGKKTPLDEEKASIDNEERLLHCALARQIMREKFKVSSTDDFALYVPPNQEVIESYTALSDPSSGPNKDKLELDMRGKISSLWNRRVIEILVEAAEKCRTTDESYKGLPKRSSQYVAGVFKRALERARVAFSNAQQKLKRDGEVESLEEVEVRMADLREKALKDVRVNTRRQGKYERRNKSVDELLAGANPTEKVVLQFTKDVIKGLGPDGMSSDDSCVENGRELFVTRKMPHRRNVEGALNIVDDHHNAKKTNWCKKGAKLTTRVRSEHAPVSRRPPFTGKSQSLYATHWMRTQSPTQIDNLSIKKDKIKWVDLDSN